MTCTITPNDSKKPLTATRSMRLVVALYSVLRTVFDSSADVAFGNFSVAIVEESLGCTGSVGAAFTKSDPFSGSDCTDCAASGATSVKLLVTRSESSRSTERVPNAALASLWVGKGI